MLLAAIFSLNIASSPRAQPYAPNGGQHLSRQRQHDDAGESRNWNNDALVSEFLNNE